MSTTQLATNNEPTSGEVHRSGKVTVSPGDEVPGLSLMSTNGRLVDLQAEASKHNLVLFFYPGDGAGKRYLELAGCTPEARSFRDLIDKLRQLDTEVFGVNLHTSARQREFVEREHLNFELLSDTSKQLVQSLNIPLWTASNGEEFVTRNTIIVRKGGRIARVFEDVNVNGHVEKVIEELQSLSN